MSKQGGNNNPMKHGTNWTCNKSNKLVSEIFYWLTDDKVIVINFKWDIWTTCK